MKKLKLIQNIVDAGVVAVIRGDSAEEVIEIARHAILGGIKVIEITLTVPKALKAIETLSDEFQSDDLTADNYAIIGAGTVLDPETARAAILNGAEFIVSPNLNEETVKLCNRYRVPVMPGAMTIQDMQSALELGVDIIKLFPGNAFSPSMIKAVKGPLPQVNIMPTGGVSLDNLHEWIKAGAAAVGIGSDLTKGLGESKDYQVITEKARQYMNAYHEAKQQ
ncbi:bifunctional 2-keto-4-hydroxyglutarate aldolase/2-keto-3-deoxy-6-phosphogluconate aldolase [Scopulibacillus cellulosilyticus]|uniref:Bifunctional 2-keto-4-hydroxyglutarate aldolase/2-keto-3-deoxy-6-phosphogluconate aldolase n=1 Tax=Scopulibacillus cellulosilyticus TaxID=2665665 RepID=A0ABW2PZH6_9BACL